MEKGKSDFHYQKSQILSEKKVGVKHVRECCEVSFFFFLILSFNLIMSSSNDLANRKVG